MVTVLFHNTVESPVRPTQIERWVKCAAKHEKKITGIIEIVLVSDKEIRRLNKMYRGKDKVTDVLSFAWQEDTVIPSGMLGQMYISYTQIARQAEEYECSVREELIRMLAHGLLHLVGYDHVTERQAKRMFGLQEKIVSSCI